MTQEFSEDISAEFLQNIQSAVDATGVVGRVEVIHTENGPMTVIFMEDGSDPNSTAKVADETVIDGSNLQSVVNSDTVVTEPPETGSFQCATTEVEVSSVADVFTSYSNPVVDTSAQVVPEFSATPFSPEVNIVYQTEGSETSVPVITEEMLSVSEVSSATNSIVPGEMFVEQEETFTATPLYQSATVSASPSKTMLSSDMYHTKSAITPHIISVNKPSELSTLSVPDVQDKASVVTEPLYTSQVVTDSKLAVTSTAYPINQTLYKPETVGSTSYVTGMTNTGEIRTVERVVPKDTLGAKVVTLNSPSVNTSHTSSYLQSGEKTLQNKRYIVTKTVKSPTENKDQGSVKRILIPKFGKTTQIVELVTEHPPGVAGKSPSQAKHISIAPPRGTSNKRVYTTQSNQSSKVAMPKTRPAKRHIEPNIEVIHPKEQVNMIPPAKKPRVTYIDSHGSPVTSLLHPSPSTATVIPKRTTISTQTQLAQSSSAMSQQKTPSIVPVNTHQIRQTKSSDPSAAGLVQRVNTVPVPSRPAKVDQSAAGIHPQTRTVSAPSQPVKASDQSMAGMVPLVSTVPAPFMPNVGVSSLPADVFKEDEGALQPVSSIEQAGSGVKAKEPLPAPEAPATSTLNLGTQSSTDGEDILQTILVENSDVEVHILKDGSLQTRDKSGTSYSKISLESLGVKPDMLTRGACIELVVVQANGTEVKTSIELDLQALKAAQENTVKQKQPGDNVTKLGPSEVSKDTEMVNKNESVRTENDTKQNSIETLQNGTGEQTNEKTAIQEDSAKNKTKDVSRPFQCSKCPRTFKFENTFKNHEAVHGRETFYTCPICKRVFAREDNLNSHIILHEQLQKAKPTNSIIQRAVAKVKQMGKQSLGESCELCGWTQNTKKYSLLQHMERVHNREPIECPICDQTFITKGSCTKHMLTHRGPYICPYCHIQIVTRDLMLAHLKESHKAVCICELCEDIIGSKSGYIQHMKTFHADYNGGKFPPKGYKFKCKDCGEKFVMYANLQKHKLQHTQGKWQCPQCSQRFGSKVSLYKHVSQVHSNKYTKFNCEKCCMTFKRKDFYDMHKEKFHTGPYNCDECGIEQAELKDLIAHRYTVHGVGLVCKICGAKFERRIDLVKHKETEHRRPANMLCDLCGAGFVHKTHMKSHLIQEHYNGDRVEMLKAYPSLRYITEKCELCHEVLKVQSSTKLHYLNKHFDGNSEAMYEAYPFLETYPDITEEFKCDHCGKMFTNMLNLQRHLLRHGIYLNLFDDDTEETVLGMEMEGEPDDDDDDVSHDMSHDISGTADVISPRQVDRNHQCKTCKRKFSRKSALKRHEQIHKADYSLIALKQMEMDDLARENDILKGKQVESPKKSKVESNVEYKCKSCNIKYTKDFQLKQHMKKIHGEGKPKLKQKFTEVKEKTPVKGKGRPQKGKSLSSTTAVGSKKLKKEKTFSVTKEKTPSSGRGRPLKDRISSRTPTTVVNKKLKKENALPEPKKHTPSSGKSRPTRNKLSPKFSTATDTKKQKKGKTLTQSKEKNRFSPRTPTTKRNKDIKEKKPEIKQKTPNSAKRKGRPPKDKKEFLSETPASVKERSQSHKTKMEVKPKTPGSGKDKVKATKFVKEKSPETPTPEDSKEMDIETFLSNNFSLGKKQLPQKEEETQPSSQESDKVNVKEEGKPNVETRDETNSPTEENESEIKYTCKICNSTYNTVNGIRKHLEIFHPMVRNNKDDQYVITQNSKQEQENKASLYQCQLCPKSFEVESNLKRHVTLKHFMGKDKQVLTKKNDKASPKRSGKDGKKKILPENNKTSNSSDEGTIKCSLCPRAFKMKQHLVQHMTKGHGIFEKIDFSALLPKPKAGKITWRPKGGSFKCESCSKTFSKAFHLNLHARHHHKNTHVKITTKDVKLKKDKVVFAKKKIVQETERVVCARCKKSFSNFGYFKRHVKLRHNTVQEQMIKRKSNEMAKMKGKDLNVKNIEGEKKKQKISTEAKSVSFSSSSSDVGTADSVADYQCKFCTDGITVFQSQDKLTAHMKHKHGKKAETNSPQKKENRQLDESNCRLSFLCKECQRVFWTKVSLTNHMRLIHPDTFALDLDRQVKQQLCGEQSPQLSLSPSTPRTSVKGLAKIKCDFCKRVLWTSRSFEEHMIEQHYSEAVKDPGAFGLVLKQTKSNESTSWSSPLKVSLENDEYMEQLSARSSVVLEKLPLEKMIHAINKQLEMEESDDSSEEELEETSEPSAIEIDTHETKTEIRHVENEIATKINENTQIELDEFDDSSEKEKGETSEPLDEGTDSRETIFKIEHEETDSGAKINENKHLKLEEDDDLSEREQGMTSEPLDVGTDSQETKMEIEHVENESGKKINENITLEEKEGDDSSENEQRMTSEQLDVGTDSQETKTEIEHVENESGTKINENLQLEEKEGDDSSENEQRMTSEQLNVGTDSQETKTEIEHVENESGTKINENLQLEEKEGDDSSENEQRMTSEQLNVGTDSQETKTEIEHVENESGTKINENIQLEEKEGDDSRENEQRMTSEPLDVGTDSQETKTEIEHVENENGTKVNENLQLEEKERDDSSENEQRMTSEQLNVGTDLQKSEIEHEENEIIENKQGFEDIKEESASCSSDIKMDSPIISDNHENGDVLEISESQQANNAEELVGNHKNEPDDIGDPEQDTESESVYTDVDIRASTELPVTFDNDCENTNRFKKITEKSNTLPESETILNGDIETYHEDSEKIDEESVVLSSNQATTPTDELAAQIDESDIEELAPLKKEHDLMETNEENEIVTTI